MAIFLDQPENPIAGSLMGIATDTSLDKWSSIIGYFAIYPIIVGCLL